MIRSAHPSGSLRLSICLRRSSTRFAPVPRRYREPLTTDAFEPTACQGFDRSQLSWLAKVCHGSLGRRGTHSPSTVSGLPDRTWNVRTTPRWILPLLNGLPQAARINQYSPPVCAASSPTDFRNAHVETLGGAWRKKRPTFTLWVLACPARGRAGLSSARRRASPGLLLESSFANHSKCCPTYMTDHVQPPTPCGMPGIHGCRWRFEHLIWHQARMWYSTTLAI